jgi:anti-sigma regulatory factor (Ser/Thr protein kinase)
VRGAKGTRRGPGVSRVRRWPAAVGLVSAIRADTRAWLGALDLAAETVDDLVLAVNEAVANVIDHAYGSRSGSVDLCFRTDGRTVCLDITDHGIWRSPVPSRNGRGHGVRVMRGVVDSVSIEHDERGTRVRLRHPLRALPQPSAP